MRNGKKINAMSSDDNHLSHAITSKKEEKSVSIAIRKINFVSIYTTRDRGISDSEYDFGTKIPKEYSQPFPDFEFSQFEQLVFYIRSMLPHRTHFLLENVD